ncbi:hypothetical protein KIN20_033167 [Parelaphostrongylus tenuis]|uniref:Uncharacterized protein n=1 Tax=Parelaphostrongylus tenuis TaxID=148309 RepID=A0AAD5R838_PARTN|nr:hypothetical protein KIN20_033145 [Parelaphostrongylus tenuis]KAJ1371253.1 hypothetical protein KIN20_033167 [Parelaphostrongylus tenuis]
MPSDVDPSRDVNGFDLHLGDVTTLQQIPSHHMNQQAQARAAISARLPDRHTPSFTGSTVVLHADVVAMAAQLSISVSVPVPTSQLLRQPILSSGTASISFSSAASSFNSKQMLPNSAAAEQQYYYLQQALSVVANVQTDKTEMRMHMMQQQAGGLGLHAFVRLLPEETVALGGGSNDTAGSPRPPQVDPSPPRIKTDPAANISDGTPSTVLHQQVRDEPLGLSVQTSPLGSYE